MLRTGILALLVGKDIHLVVVLVASLRITEQRPHPLHSPLAASLGKQSFVVQPCIFGFALHAPKVLLDLLVCFDGLCPLGADLLCIFGKLQSTLAMNTVHRGAAARDYWQWPLADRRFRLQLNPTATGGSGPPCRSARLSTTASKVQLLLPTVRFRRTLPNTSCSACAGAC